MPHNNSAPTPARPSAGDSQQDEPRFSGRLHYYQRKTSDWLGSALRYSMTLEQRGVWSDVEAWIYQEGSITDDRHALLGLLALRDPDALDRVWPAIAKHLIPHPDLPGHLTLPGALKQRAEYAAYLAEQQRKGRKSAERRRGAATQPRLNRGSTKPSPSPQPLPFPEPSPSPDALRAETDGGDPPTFGQPAAGRERAPASTSTSPDPAPPAGNDRAARFARWWAIYPKHQHRQAAWSAYQHVIRTDADYELLMRTTPLHIERQLQHREPAWIPDPATYLRRGDWRDEDPPLLKRGPASESRPPLAERIKTL